jgi:hypothetical protein
VKNVTLTLPNVPGALARMGEALGSAGVSLEGGGVFAVGETAVANFLVEDGERAATVLRAAGFQAVQVRDVLLRKLDQGRPGQLGALTRRLADAGVNIEVQYSDHEHRLVLVVSEPARAAAVTDEWSVRADESRLRDGARSGSRDAPTEPAPMEDAR